LLCNDPASSAIYTLSLHDALPICGAIPVLGYVAGRLILGAALSGLGALVIAFVFSAAFLFLIGSARSFFTGKGGVRSGVEMLVVGTVVAVITYAVGVLFRA